jgi:hypothetical protein
VACQPYARGDKNAKELDGLSLVGVTQIDRIVEAVGLAGTFHHVIL